LTSLTRSFRILFSFLFALAFFAVGGQTALAHGSSNGSGSSGDKTEEIADPNEDDDKSDDRNDDDDRADDRDDDKSGDSRSDERSNSGSGSGDDRDESGGSDGGRSGSSSDGDDHGDTIDHSGHSGSASRSRSRDGDEASGLSRTGVAGTSGTTSSAARERAVEHVEARIELMEIKRGERARAGEVIHLSSRSDISRLVARRGLRIIESFELPALGMSGVRISISSRAEGKSLFRKLRKVDPHGITTFNHIYSPARGPSVGASTSIPMTAVVAGNAVRLDGRIGLVDAGVDRNHPLLSEVDISERNFGLASLSAEKHGTAVASRIAEVAPGARIVVASVFSIMRGGEEIASVDSIIRGLSWLSQMRVPVINLSLTGPANPILEAVTGKLISRGHILVAAVGNEGPYAAPRYPAAYDNVVGVTAVDSLGHIYRYANQGAYVDFAAAGVDAPVAKSPGDVEMASGTSYAAPVVSVELARLLKRPDPEGARKATESLKGQALDLGEPGRDPVFGYGEIGAAR